MNNTGCFIDQSLTRNYSSGFPTDRDACPPLDHSRLSDSLRHRTWTVGRPRREQFFCRAHLALGGVARSLVGGRSLTGCEHLHSAPFFLRTSNQRCHPAQQQLQEGAGTAGLEEQHCTFPRNQDGPPRRRGNSTPDIRPERRNLSPNKWPLCTRGAPSCSPSSLQPSEETLTGRAHFPTSSSLCPPKRHFWPQVPLPGRKSRPGFQMLTGGWAKEPGTASLLSSAA